MYETFQEERKKSLRLSTMQQLALGFFLVILIGAFVLWLPISNAGERISFIDSLFTATSAVCVTGLMTITPAVQFTLFGKIVLLLLIQIGGLGVVACTMAFFVIIGKKITMKERVTIQESYNLDTLSGLVHMVIRIMKMTFVVELVGMVFFAFQFVPEFGLRGIWYSLFHSVSAFCNAGIDILGTESFLSYTLNPIVNFTTMMLIVIGGLGFTVWIDVAHTIKDTLKKQRSWRHVFRRLQLHSKIVITMTIILLTLGFVIFACLEWNNPGTIGNLETKDKLMASMFQSVTTRTAGFATIEQGALLEESAFFTGILMFIGGSPAGTAGGVKTTTIAMLLLTCFAVLRRSKDTECFGRRIPEENIKTGISIIIVSFTFMIFGVIAMNIVQDAPFLDIMFEVNSALGTVGLTRGITPELTTIGKMIDIILMYVGRIGPITMALAFGYRKHSKTLLRELPTKRIIVG